MVALAVNGLLLKREIGYNIKAWTSAFLKNYLRNKLLDTSMSHDSCFYPVAKASVEISGKNSCNKTIEIYHPKLSETKCFCVSRFMFFSFT